MHVIVLSACVHMYCISTMSAEAGRGHRFYGNFPVSARNQTQVLNKSSQYS